MSMENVIQRKWFWFNMSYIEEFKNGYNQIYLIEFWTRLLPKYDLTKGIKWNWQSLDSITVKSLLGGR